ncbi:hypothetical protein [Alteromonas sp. H39]|uniref:hypothetical protein n=1 Tax=Alteromonas sp. H39 TaxID=3389876 RepID=UPI0039E048F1
MRHYFLILLFLFFTSFTFPSTASMMSFSFTGIINDVSNNNQSYWNEQTLDGMTVEGTFTLDTSAPIGGRLETGWYWWWVNDNAPPVLTSYISFGGTTYSLNNEGTYNAEYDQYNPDEYISMTNGPDFDGGPVGDGVHFTDRASFTEDTPVGVRNASWELDAWFIDYVRDFLQFPEQNTIPIEIPPDFEQVFTWEDDDLSDNTERLGGGSLNYYESIYNQENGFTTLFDSTVNFELTRFEATRVPAPATFLLLMIATSIIFVNRSKTKA